jgi:hypothetical protein
MVGKNEQRGPPGHSRQTREKRGDRLLLGGKLLPVGCYIGPSELQPRIGGADPRFRRIDRLRRRSLVGMKPVGFALRLGSGPFELRRLSFG